MLRVIVPVRVTGIKAELQPHFKLNKRASDQRTRRIRRSRRTLRESPWFSTMKKSLRLALTVAILAGVAVLALLGSRLAPPVLTPTGSDSRSSCKVEAPQALRAAAQHWCTNGLFARVSVTGDDQHVIAVAQFSPNGAQVWQIQTSGLLPTFRGLTEQMAGAAKGRDVSISVHDAADRRVAACARVPTDAAAKCELK